MAWKFSDFILQHLTLTLSEDLFPPPAWHSIVQSLENLHADKGCSSGRFTPWTLHHTTNLLNSCETYPKPPHLHALVCAMEEVSAQHSALV